MKLHNKRWTLKDSSQDVLNEFTSKLGINELKAKLLYNRGINNIEKGTKLLNGDLNNTIDEYLYIRDSDQVNLKNDDKDDVSLIEIDLELENKDISFGLIEKVKELVILWT